MIWARKITSEGPCVPWVADNPIAGTRQNARIPASAGLQRRDTRNILSCPVSDQMFIAPAGVRVPCTPDARPALFASVRFPHPEQVASLIASGNAAQNGTVT